VKRIPIIGLGNVYDSLGEYQKAIEFYQKSLEIFQEMESIIGEPKTLFNLGLTYYKLKRISEAKEAYLQVAGIISSIGVSRICSIL
jgi:tetratricopeptide (TPR) repeat protein